MTDFQYDAFISYRHIDPDRQYAKWLHKALETYRVPKQLVSNGISPRIKKVFRDEDELHASPNLSDEIDLALQKSRFLIVICSPRIIDSVWCDQEVKRFRELGRDDQILALLVEGEPSESFLPSLCEIRRTIITEDGSSIEEIEEVEPLAADVREVPGESSRELKYLAKLRLLACILGCKFDDLRRREQQRRKKRLVYASIFLFTILIAMTGLTVWALKAESMANEQRQRAETEKEKALDAERKALESEQEAVKQKDIAVKEKNIAIRTAYRANILLAQQAYQKFNFRVGNKHLLECPPELRGWEWRYLWKNNNHYKNAWQNDQNDIFRFKINAIQKTYLTATEKELKIWDLVNHKIIKTIKLSSDLRNIDFTPDGEQIFCSYDEEIEIYETENYSKVNTLPDVKFNKFSPDGKIFISNTSSEITVWDSNSFEKKSVLKGHFERGDGLGISGLAFSPDGKMIASSSFDKTVRIWDVTTYKELSVFKLGESPYKIQFSSDSSKVFCGFWNSGKIKLWDVKTHQEAGEIDGKFGYIRFLANYQNSIIAGFNNGSIRVWNEKLEETSVLKGESSTIDYIYLFDQNIISLSSAGDFKLWEIKHNKEMKNAKIFRDVKFSPEYDEFISTTDDGKIRIVDLESFEEYFSLNFHEKKTDTANIQIELSSDGKLILGLSYDSVKLWDRHTQTPIATFDKESKGKFSSDGKYIITVKENCIIFRDVAKFKVVKKLYTIEKGIDNIFFDSKNNNILCTAYVPYKSLGRETYIWSLESFQLLKKIKGTVSAVSQKGSIIINDQKNVSIFEGRSFEKLKNLGNHEISSQSSITYSPDSKRIISTEGKDLNIWDSSSYELLLKLNSESIYSADVSPNSKKILCRHSNEIKIHDATLDNAKWISKSRILGKPSLVLLDLLKKHNTPIDEICAILKLKPDLTKTLENKTAFQWAENLKNQKIVQKILNESLVQAGGKDLKMVKRLIDKGADINYQNHTRNCALRQAIKAKKVDIAEFLINNGADVNQQDDIKRTPLIHAAIHKLNKIVVSLVQKGAVVNQQGEYGWNALMIAAQYTDTAKTIKFLIDNGADIKLLGRYGRTALLIAIREAGEKAIPYLNLLVDKSVLNLKDDFGINALFYAVANKNKSAVSFLIENGADINSGNNEGHTPLIKAIDEGFIETAKLILKFNPKINLETKNKWSAFTFAVQSKNLEMMKLLVKRGADVNRKEKIGWTPLMILCQYKGAYNHIKYLLDEGADANLVNSEGSVALQIALYQSPDNNNLNIVKLLGVNTHLNYQNSYGWNALMYAVRHDKLDAMKFLVEQGADINLQEKAVGNWSALMMASEKSGNHEAVRYLMQKGADPNLQLKDGRTALMIAVQHPKHPQTSNLESIKLIAEKADLNIKDNIGKTALIWSVNKKDIEAVRFLLNKGANKVIEDQYDKTALDYARANRLTKIMELLK